MSKCGTLGWISVGLVIGIFLFGISMAPHAKYIYYERTSDIQTNSLISPVVQVRSTQLEQERDKVLSSLSGPTIAMDDRRLVSAIAKYMLDSPRPFLSKFSYSLFETPQAKEAMKVLKMKKNGFFVECGGLDGERSSNTIYMENKHGWTGLLVEMDPSWYMQLRGKNRKSYSINSCLSPHKYPVEMTFKEHNMGQGKLLTSSDSSGSKAVLKTYCFPLYSIMLAMNRTKIDFFSLDVEGREVAILKTIPWDKLDISVLTVEYVHGNGEKEYIDYMDSVGYRMHKRIKAFKPEIYFGCNDFIFVKKSLKL